MHFLIVLVAARTIEREDWADGLTVLTPVAALALLNGVVLAKSRAPELLTHTLSFLLGLALAIALTAATLDGAVGWRQRLDFLWDRAALWVRQAEAGRRIDDADLFVLMMAFTVWLVAYSSSWMLYRRRWLIAAAALPGMVIVINLGYATDSSSAPLVIYTLGALVLAARHFAFRRQVEWSRTRLPSPDRLPWHFVRSGLSIALVVVLFGWTLPTNAARPLLQHIAERLDRPLDAIEDRWNDLITPLNRESRSGGSFASFGESFRLGGALNLSDEPVAVVQADRPVYLTAFHYNRYDGHGWSTDVEDTFRSLGDDGEQRAPLITFQPEQSVFLSSEMTGDRSREGAEIVVLRPKGDLLFSIYTYVSSSETASVQVSWRQLNEAEFDVQGTDLGDQPEDLRQLISLLRDAEHEPGVSGDDQRISDPAMAAQILAMRTELRESRFLDTTWTIGDDGRVETLFVTGQLPIYDDVEAVRAEETPAQGDRYQVTGLASFADPDDLRQASTDFPDFVDARYMMLPTTVTRQTVDLARQVAAGADSQYDQALAIQDYLRTTFAYDENIEVPPDDQDVVDYFLFESQRGYCEYFASAMVVMLRSLDIPSRIAAGYRSVPFDDGAGGYLYREKQAHTWVEVFIPGYGWIPFEPTPAAEPFQHGADQEQQPDVIPPATVEPLPTPTVAPTPTPEPMATPGAVGVMEEPRASDEGISRYADELVVGTGILVVLAFLGVGAASLIWLWGFRGMSPIGALYARVQRVGRLWGLRPDPSLTPVEYARELGHVAPTMRTPARMLAQLYEAEQYGGRPVTPVDAAVGQSAWKELRAAVLRSWRRRRRIREKQRGV
ncbi:MAG: DUF4129 domain-containing transglutaminase family protein [Thermomicrobiales bacterium]